MTWTLFFLRVFVRIGREEKKRSSTEIIPLRHKKILCRQYFPVLSRPGAGVILRVAMPAAMTKDIDWIEVPFRVLKEHEGRRLDAFLQGRLGKKYSRMAVQKLIDDG